MKKNKKKGNGNDDSGELNSKDRQQSGNDAKIVAA